MITRALFVRATPAAALFGIACLAHAQNLTPPQVPDAIKAPSGERVVLRAHATGMQIYLCAVDASGKAQPWTLKAPEAELRDDKGALIGHHSAGPSWTHKDGSEVSGKAVAKVDAPDPDSIPWLLVSATAHSGAGVFAGVTSVQRIHTQGGKAPEGASCDPTKPKERELRVPYAADYYFYAPAAH